MHRAAVLGSPVAHSLSPTLHQAAYDALGLVGWSYGAHDVGQQDLAAFLDGLDDTWVGLSLTMPLKAAVLPLLDSTTPVVDAVGAANTVLLAGGRRAGDNTDVPGLVAALAQHGITSVSRAVVLGGGATARSALAALASVTTDVTAYVRDPASGPGLAAVAAAYGVAVGVLPWADAADGLGAPLVVSTVVAGATDALAGGRIPNRPGTLFEVLYDPWPTALAAAWSAAGGPVIDGLDLLVHQAVLQVAAMTAEAGIVADPAALVPVLRAAGERALRSG